MFNRLDAIEEKYNELTKDLSNPEILNDFILITILMYLIKKYGLIK